GTAKVVEDDADLLVRLTPDGYRARPERVILFTIAAIDINCPQHIVQRFDEATVRLATEKLAARVAELEAENKALRRELAARA
ncbi:MAG: pyridoxamine 5'-phosphate oxidase, partial [Gammaproteobacteria bacterium]